MTIWGADKLSSDADPYVCRLGYTLRRYYVDSFYDRTVSGLPSGSLILDAGGTSIMKKGRFDVTKYGVKSVSVNISVKRFPDIQADAAFLPMRSGIFDAVICGELLEHVREPILVLKEACRVLRCGGVLLSTVPFLYRIHGSPEDFGRYTDQFWQVTLREAGFSEVLIQWHGLFFSVLLDFAKQYMSEIGVKRPFGRMAQWLLNRAQNVVLRYEQRSAVRSNQFLRSFTTGFGLIAQKDSGTTFRGLVTRLNGNIASEPG